MVDSLHRVLQELQKTSCPTIENPPNCNKRASVALCVRIRPQYAFWPEAKVPSQATDVGSVASLDDFFAQSWVQHGVSEVLFIRRAARPGDRWTGHVALPGGKRDAQDEDDRATAVRETWEEVGLDLTAASCIYVGSLPERVVTTSWGTVPLMVLCPFVFLLTCHDIPPLRLQPTEVESAHWVPLRSLLSPSLRTFEHADVSERLARRGAYVTRMLLRAMLGYMLFAAVKLTPSESLYSDVMPDPPPTSSGTAVRTDGASVAAELRVWWSGKGQESTSKTRPLLLWGLTFGIVNDLLQLFPPHDAIEQWSYPTFTRPDIQLVLWVTTYSFRARKWAEVKRQASEDTGQHDPDPASAPRPRSPPSPSAPPSPRASRTMHFGQNLKDSVYAPWKSHYVDYGKLKKLLRETENDQRKDWPTSPNPPAESETADQWTEDDEGAFVDELVNVQLGKVYDFQVNTYLELRERTAKYEYDLEDMVALGESDQSEPRQSRQEQLQKVLTALDDITRETNELEKFSRINFTGLFKAAKKHDRKRGHRYRVRPLLQARLAALPFNVEDYSPLLYRLSAMYAFVRENVEGPRRDSVQSASETHVDSRRYTTHTFWVHPDNLLEVKIRILRRLPVLVYNPQDAKAVGPANKDPTITCLYFDNPDFDLYTQKIDRVPGSSSLRLRWHGQLSDKPEIFFEKESIQEDERVEETRFPIKEKHIQPFIKNEYKMEKAVRKVQDRQGQTEEAVEHFRQTLKDIQGFIREKRLQPVLRANYTRTAFQIPGDDRVRIALDTNLALIREDALDEEQPCRNPAEWHRRDIDENKMEYPFDTVEKGEISRFPFASLEIKLRDGVTSPSNEWILDLMVSHLVKEAPRFSKYVHGTAQLFEDQVNSFPFWLSEVDSDIRKDPGTAFREEEQKKAKKAEDDFTVGSFVGSKSSTMFRGMEGSPASKGRRASQALDVAGFPASPSTSKRYSHGSMEPPELEIQDEPRTTALPSSRSGLAAYFPSFSTSKYARAHQYGSVQLPPGVRKPGRLIKDAGPVNVEAKVWLANQRTFIKWQHVSILLASLSLGLYNAAGRGNNVARTLAVVYTLVAVFAAVWGWAMYMQRSRLIRQRSGKDFDNILGPVIVCLSLVVALCLNFGFKYNAVMERLRPGPNEGYNTTEVMELSIGGAGLAQQAL
ncbi:MAG: Phosphate metabolism transcription protein [Thelocarpon superellum]|nr:MAG: Phosphate metabolism transcription protein [Thelocarpon superellum]